MTREDAEILTVRMAKPVLAYLASRCSTPEDAEDLSQEILFRAYRTLLGKNDVGDPERYVWRCARNGLANYYRGKARHSVGIPLDEIADRLPDPEGITSARRGSSRPGSSRYFPTAAGAVPAGTDGTDSASGRRILRGRDAGSRTITPRKQCGIGAF